MEDDDMECYKFAKGEEPTILTGILDDCREGRHNECMGRVEYQGELVFCICSCHEMPHEA